MASSEALVRPPRQRRSRESFNRAVEAGIDLLEQRGYEAFTIAEISHRAGVSVGSIYARFGSKEELFLAVQDLALKRLDNEVERLLDPDRWHGREPAEFVPAAVGALVEVVHRHERLMGALVRRGAADERVLARGSASAHRSALAFTNVLLMRRDAIRHPDPEVAADMCYRMVFGALLRRIAYGPTFEAPVRHSWERFTQELAAACTAYLLCEPGRAPEGRRRPTRPRKN